MSISYSLTNYLLIQQQVLLNKIVRAYSQLKNIAMFAGP